MGLPHYQALFEIASIPYVLIYYMCNTDLFGQDLLDQQTVRRKQFDLKMSVKKVFSPPLMERLHLGTDA